jgi:hypothetical protein
MAWTTPRTWATNDVVTAALLNEQLRDNLLETMPAKARRPGSHFTTSIDNEITERYTVASRLATAEQLDNTDYTDLTTYGPTVTAETGAHAMVAYSCQMSNAGTGAQSTMSFEVTGATNIDAAQTDAIIQDALGQADAPWMFSGFCHLKNLTPGFNTFTCKYKTGGVNTATYSERFIAVFPM